MTTVPTATRLPASPSRPADQTKTAFEQRFRAIRTLDEGATADEAASAAGVTRRTIQNWKKDRNDLWDEFIAGTVDRGSRDEEVASLARLQAERDFVTEALLSSYSGARKIVERVRFAWLLRHEFTLRRAAGVVGVSYNTAVNWRNRLDELERKERADVWQELDEVGKEDPDLFLLVCITGDAATLEWATQGLQLEPERIS